MSDQPTVSGRDSRVEGLLMIVIVIWAANYPVAKYGIEGMNIFVFNGIRYAVAAALLVVVFAVRTRWTLIARDDWPKLIRAGFVANVIYQIAFIIGLSMTTAGNSAILLATSPLWTVFLSAKLHHQPVQKEVWTGMVISLLGVSMIVLGGESGLEIGWAGLWGDCITLAAAFLWGFNTTIQKPLLVRYSSQQVSLIMVSVGAAGLCLIAVPPSTTMQWGATHWSYYAAAIASGVASIGIGNLFWSYGVQRLGPSRTGNFGNLTPVLALVFSYLALHEEIGVLQVFGAGVTLLGVWYARR